MKTVEMEVDPKDPSIFPFPQGNIDYEMVDTTTESYIDTAILRRIWKRNSRKWPGTQAISDAGGISSSKNLLTLPQNYSRYRFAGSRLKPTPAELLLVSMTTLAFILLVSLSFIPTTAVLPTAPRP
ncbi:MAG: hypothetical protein OXH65_11925 [Paracoccaceae bacterium]|nr:hypothetical protein [Paracoccaceae bacterium]MDE2675803.1 hypothetical protein [Paracoccaceae bacterium]MDE2737895.1 hypothetical protein [Paracoccaceae bacterium]